MIDPHVASHAAPPSGADPDSPAAFPAFAVAVGEEGSDPLVVKNGVLIRMDQYAASGHLDRQDEDLRDIATLGVNVIRYGMPWRITEAEAGRYDWTLWDAAFAACDRHGLTPVVDLVHFGLPDHLDGGFCDPVWIDSFVRYVDAFLARYPEPMWFTPVNEPGITAVASALFGIWNDRLAAPETYAIALGNLTLANLEAIARIRADRDGWWIGSEGFSCNVPTGTSEDAVAEARREADDATAMQQLVWDLHLGVDVPPSVAALVDHIDPAIRARIEDLAIRDDHHVVAGHDVYPVGVTRYGNGEHPPLGPDALAAAYAEAGRAWHGRYQRPFWVAETSNLGLPVGDQAAWLASLMSVLDAMHDDGLPVRGICWYSRGDQFDWQSMLAEPTGALTEVGLFDHQRTPRPVAAAYSALANRRR